MKARAEIKDREWIEVDLQISAQRVVDQAAYHAQGCHKLMDAASRFTLLAKGKSIDELRWAGTSHEDILIREIVLKFQNRFDFPYGEEELCHCRQIPAAKVDEAIVLGAHTPETVTAWTSASSGCGTCRPNVARIIAFRLDQNSIIERARAVIEREIRPMIQGDGGDIEIVALKEGHILQVRLQGTCTFCAASAQTLSFGVEERIKAAIPEITAVEQVR